MHEKDVPMPQIKPCRQCGEQLAFWDNCRTINGKRIPYNLDGSKHICKRAWDDERAISEAITYIVELNSKLQTCTIGLTRRDKEPKA